MGIRRIGLTVIGMLIVVSIISSSGCRKAENSITLAGSTAFQPFAEELAEMYMKTHPEARINVQGGGSIVGIQSAKEGAADIGMADLLRLPQEVEEQLNSVIVAKDGIAIVINPANKIENITLKDARSIFSGQIRNWKELGGEDHIIDVISREEGSGTRRSFEELVLNGVRLSNEALFQDSNGTIRESVATSPHSIGYISIGFLNERIKPLKLDGASPTNENIIAGLYPLARPVFFLTKGEPSRLVKEFIDFVMAREGQNLIKEKSLIPAREY